MNEQVKKEVPLYYSIYSDLKEKIIHEELREGDKLPYERELCETYQVNRITVRKALELLVKEGFVEKQPGRGSFIKLRDISAEVKANSNTPHNKFLFAMYNNDNDINSNPFSQNISLFSAIEQECKLDNNVLFYATLDEQSDLSSLVSENNFAGIFFVSYIPEHILAECVQMNIPAVCINNRHTSIISVVPENERGTYEAVKYLQSRGHKRIAIMLGKENYYSTNERFKGYSAAMYSFGQSADARCILEGGWTFEGARKAVFEMLDSFLAVELPTAIFCCSDGMAIGAMDALKERGFSIPKDISIMGFDDIQQSEQAFPRISTVSVDIKHMAELAVEKIMSNGQSASRKAYVMQIPTELIIRQSVGEVK